MIDNWDLNNTRLNGRKCGVYVKRIILLLLLISSTSIFSEIAFDSNTNKYYSKNASKKVNQDEYNNLVWQIKGIIHPKAILDLNAVEMASLFLELKSVGTPASLRLMDDLKQVIKEIKKEIKDLQS